MKKIKTQPDYRFHILYFLSYCTIFGYTSYEQTACQDIVSKQVHKPTWSQNLMNHKNFTELPTLFLFHFLLYRCNQGFKKGSPTVFGTQYPNFLNVWVTAFVCDLPRYQQMRQNHNATKLIFKTLDATWAVEPTWDEAT